jgi:hypothetical protein
MSNIKYVGMDVHKSITVIVVLDAIGQVESRSQVKTKAENLCDFFHGMSGKVEVVKGSCHEALFRNSDLRNKVVRLCM